MSPPPWPDDLLAPLVRRPRQAGVFTDYDGTLAEIVLDPAEARPVPGAVEALDALAGRMRTVGVLSGRPVSFLEEHLPPSVVLAGLYGLERSEHGMRSDHPQAGSWREVVDDVVAVSRARGPEGMRVESKGLSITLHYRGHAEAEQEVAAWADEQAHRSGLVRRGARMSIELHPPIAADKGTAIRELASGLKAVVYIGDDVGDLPAYDALDEMARAGIDVVRVAVRSDEASPEVTDRADLVVDDPASTAALLAHLAQGAMGRKAS